MHQGTTVAPAWPLARPRCTDRPKCILHSRSMLPSQQITSKSPNRIKISPLKPDLPIDPHNGGVSPVNYRRSSHWTSRLKQELYRSAHSPRLHTGYLQTICHSATPPRSCSTLRLYQTRLLASQSRDLLCAFTLTTIAHNAISLAEHTSLQQSLSMQPHHQPFKSAMCSLSFPLMAQPNSSKLVLRGE